MALQSSGPISVGDINDEIGESTDSTLDLQTAAQKFPDILDDDAVSMDEFYGLTFSAGVGTYGTRNSHAFRFVAGSPNRGFADGELVSAAENSTTDLGGASLTGQSDFVDDFIDNDLTNGDTIFANSTGATKTNLRPGGDFASGTHFLLDTTANKIGQVDSNGDVSNVLDIGRTPGNLTISETSKTDTTITISIVGDTRVTRLLAPFRDGVELTNVAPSDSGNLSNTNTTTSYTYTGLTAGTTYALKVRGENTFANGADSNTLNIQTNAADVNRTLSEMYIYQLDDSGPPPDEELKFRGWEDDELIQCVNGTQSPTAPTGGGNTLPGDASGDTYTFDSSPDINLSAFGGFSDTNTATINGNQTFGDVTFSDNANFDGNDKFFRNETDLKIHQIGNGTGTISNTISFTPATLTISLVSKTTTSVTVRATGNTQVIDTLRFYRDTTEGTKTDHTKGAVGNTNVTADFTFGGLTANTSYAFKVRGENNSGTSGAVRAGSDSNTINVTTDPLPITISPTSVAGDTIADGTEVIAQIVTVTIASPSSPVIYVDNASNTRYKQATTSGGLSSASFTTPTTSTGGQSLTLSGGNQVFLQFEITNTSPVFNRTYTVKNGSDTETISVTEVER